MWEWLSKILPEHITISPSITINHIKIGSNSNVGSPVSVEGDKLVVNDADPLGKEIAAKIIKELPTHLSHNDLVIEEENLDHLESIDEDIKKSNYTKELEKYKGLVPKKDMPILEVAILISIKYKRGENVSSLKAQVVQRYGPRAGMICNLYSSGYFDTWIMPLYQTIEGGILALDEYLDVYEMIVTESPLAMFIGVGMTKARAKVLLLDKIKSNKNNEVGYLNIHGIGDVNIRLIKTLLKDEEICKQFTEEPTITLLGKSIKAVVYI